jgi:hypothetical protein
MVKITAQEPRTPDIGDALFGEVGLYILEGGISNDGHHYGPKQILVAKEASLCSFTMDAGSTVFLFGGAPLPEDRFIEWNFVASGRALIDAAKQRWMEQAFAPVSGETEFVPLPSKSAFHSGTMAARYIPKGTLAAPRCP